MNAPARQHQPAAAPGPTKQLIRFATGLSYSDLTDAERKAIRRHVLDTLGACLAGSRGEAAQIAASVLRDVTAPGQFCAPGMEEKFDILSAAFLAGGSCHGIELDDGYRAGSLHPGTVVIPALLAAIQDGDYDGRQFMAAVAVGYETQCKIGEAMHPRTRERGFHNTSIAGVFAAAAAVGKLRGLDEPTLEQALGIAASSASGLFAFLHGGGEIKRLHPGHAAREGLFAVLLAERGMTGPVDVLESRDGFFAAYASPDRALRLSREPGKAGAALAITRCYLKPYACCRHLHSAIDGILEIRRAQGLDIDAIKQIDIGTYAIAAEHAHTGWRDMASAQMSFPFCAALAATHGHVDLDDFSEAGRSDRAVIGSTAKVRIAVDPECDQIYPKARAARTVITTRDGRRFEQMVREPFGSSERPMPDDLVSAKFRKLAGVVLEPRKIAALETMVANLDMLASARDLARGVAAG
jgi:2-methylcitrate dehydratase PrpD